jgi:hypothetical protein
MSPPSSGCLLLHRGRGRGRQNGPIGVIMAVRMKLDILLDPAIQGFGLGLILGLALPSLKKSHVRLSTPVWSHRIMCDTNEAC